MARQHSNKNKSEKSKTLTETPTTKYLIAGKLDENEWNDIIDDEESEEIASEYVSDLMNYVIGEAYKIYLSRQLIPFTVHQTSEALLQMIELEFMNSDPADCVTNVDWLKDSVPLSCKIDSWAQGAISKRCDKSVLQLPEEIRSKMDELITESSTKGTTVCEHQKLAEVNPDAENTDASLIKNFSTSNPTPVTQETKSIKVKGSKTIKPTKSTEQKQLIQNSSNSSSKQRKSFSFQPHRGKLAPIAQMDETLDVKEPVRQTLRKKPEFQLKKPIAPQQRFPGSRRFAFDDEGNLVGVPRLVSTPTQVSRANKQAVLQEQPADRLGSLTNTVNLKWRVLANPADEELQVTPDVWENSLTQDLQKKKSPRNGAQDIKMMKRKMQVKSMVSGLYSVIDLMDPMPGVTVSDGERTRVGTNLSNEQKNHLLESLWNELKEVPQINDRKTPDQTILRLPPESMLKLEAIQVCKERETDAVPK